MRSHLERIRRNRHWRQSANRLNALKSTGPQTPEGKAAVKLNALRHGLRARTVVLPGENPDDFQQLCDDLETEWQPTSRSEQFYVEQMAISQWKLTRIEVAEKSIVPQEAAAKIQIALAIAVPLGRSYAKAQRELERLQNPGAGNPPSSSHRAQRVSDGPHPERGDPDPLDDSHASPDPQDPDPQNG